MGKRQTYRCTRHCYKHSFSMCSNTHKILGNSPFFCVYASSISPLNIVTVTFPPSSSTIFNLNPTQNYHIFARALSIDSCSTEKMAKSFAFSLCFSLLLLTLVPISYADIRWSSKAQNGGVPAQELWCVAKNNAEDAALQTALDWACGAGGADCSPIQQGGPCYDPSNAQNSASYAFNDYFLKHGLTDDSCNFDNNAAVTALNPSHGSCKFPSSLTVSNNGSFSGSTSSSSSSSVGLGPSEDMSRCSKVSWTWFWPLITIHLLLMVSLIFSG